ncbi:beta-carotene hydroxylase 2, chloroplastic-like isoform X2 [Magnolia sinica]|uniref:beta-carotene hydroxylase 2, chloroplastic-like isoform X2 n=1 Tax=Magnolia sinica TaxID=86752 RepID=UPI00265ADC94|nr:beta-carotene hydroxylase 2, chloroplastic-like isoform X2 [Magnolia sinica]
MEAGISAAATLKPYRFGRNPFLGQKPRTGISNCFLFFSPLTRRTDRIIQRRRPISTVCFLTSDKKEDNLEEEEPVLVVLEENREQISAVRAAERMARRRSERSTYLIAAIMSSLGITSMAVTAVYYRFSWQFQGGVIPVSEMFGTFALSVGAAVGMEFWARWAHKSLWHASLWHMHESHHRPRDGPFELNDVFAIINAGPAIALLSYGFFNKGLVPGLCFGAGLGITMFGMAYMFVHDGLVHRRFPVGPIADVPYFRRVAAAHQELEEVGGIEELEKEINRRIKLSNTSKPSS